MLDYVLVAPRWYSGGFVAQPIPSEVSSDHRPVSARLSTDEIMRVHRLG